MAMEPEELEEEVPPRGHVKVVYTGPVAPHWEIHRVFGDQHASTSSASGPWPGCSSSRSTTRSSAATASASPATPSASTSSSSGTSATSRSSGAIRRIWRERNGRCSGVEARRAQAHHVGNLAQRRSHQVWLPKTLVAVTSHATPMARAQTSIVSGRASHRHELRACIASVRLLVAGALPTTSPKPSLRSSAGTNSRPRPR